MKKIFRIIREYKRKLKLYDFLRECKEENEDIIGKSMYWMQRGDNGEYRYMNDSDYVCNLIAAIQKSEKRIESIENLIKEIIK